MSGSFKPKPREARLLLGAAAALAAIAAVPSHACSVRLGPVNATPIVYDPFVVVGSGGWIRVTADLVEGESCDAVVVLTDDSSVPLRSLEFGPDRAVSFHARLKTEAGVRESIDPAEAMVELSTAKPHAEIAWQLQSAADGILAPGDYTLPVRVQLRVPAEAAVPSSGTVALRSIARAQINLAGTAGSYESGSDAATIDLGELKTGGTGRAFLQLRSNTPANLSFTSEHRGKLANITTGTTIPYELTFDGRRVDLGNTGRLAAETPPTLRGSSFELGVTVGEVGGAAAGRYSDTIVIDVSP